MAAFPERPVSAQVFIEEFLPSLFAGLDLNDAERALGFRIGVVLRGDGGGAWTLRVVGGELEIEVGRFEECEITIVQPVEDWRSALWEGRPGLVADLVDAVFREGPEGQLFGQSAVARRPPPTSLTGLSDLKGLVEVVVAGDGPDTDWRLGIRIGPGPIPETAQATVRLGAEQAEAIRRGDLHPVEALITGQLRLEGDLGLILQLQAVAMTATMPTP